MFSLLVKTFYYLLLSFYALIHRFFSHVTHVSKNNKESEGHEEKNAFAHIVNSASLINLCLLAALLCFRICSFFFSRPFHLQNAFVVKQRITKHAAEFSFADCFRACTPAIWTFLVFHFCFLWLE